MLKAIQQMTKYFFVSGYKGEQSNKMSDNDTKLRDKARNLYKQTRSIKKTAKKLRISKAHVKRLIGDLINQQPQQPSRQITKRDKPKQKMSRPSTSYGSNASGTLHSRVRTPQKVTNPKKVFPTNYGAFEVITSEPWGSVLVPVEDPRYRQVTVNDINGIRLADSFPKVPADLWVRWIDLCFHFCSIIPSQRSSSSRSLIHRSWNNSRNNYEYYTITNGVKKYCTITEWAMQSSSNYQNMGFSSRTELEVSALFCRRKDDLSIWRMLIPEQIVGGARVRARVGRSIDLATGERFEQFPPQGWVHAGSTHSHNTMDAFFSSTDDDNEISVPGLHIVVGRVNDITNSYTPKASIVLRRLRKDVSFKDVVDSDPDHASPDATFHPDVLDYISTGWSQSLYTKVEPKVEIENSLFDSPKQTDKELDFIDDEVYLKIKDDPNFKAWKQETCATMLSECDDSIDVDAVMNHYYGEKDSDQIFNEEEVDIPILPWQEKMDRDFKSDS
jgi:hypothetical protein